MACPNGLTVFLEGTGPPRTALLIFLDERPVGGGSTNAAGAYRLPLTVRERPGIYTVDVQTRSERIPVGQFSCYVDVPLNTQPTPTPEIVATSVQPGATTQPTPTRLPAGVTPTATAAAQPGNATPTATSGSGYPPPTGNATATATTTASPTPTTEAGAIPDDAVSIIDITLREASQANNPRAEFVQISNDSDITFNIAGWRLVNTTRANRPTYTFPAFNFSSGLALIVFSGQGTDDPSEAEFYWGQSGNVWSIGDVAELRNAEGQVLSTYTVGE